MNPRRRWVWLGYFAGVGVLVLVLLGVSGQVLSLERAEVRSRAETAQQESSRLALWRMDSWLAPVLAREARRPYFEYRPVLPVGRAYEQMWGPIEAGERVVPSPLIFAGVDGEPGVEDDNQTGPLIRLHLQIEPDGSVSSPQHPSDADLANLVLADPLIAMGSAERDRAGAILSVLTPMFDSPDLIELALLDQRVGLDVAPRERARGASANAPSSNAASLPSLASPIQIEESRRADRLAGAVFGEQSQAAQPIQTNGLSEYNARQELANLAQQAEDPNQKFYSYNTAAKGEEQSRADEPETLSDGPLDLPAELDLDSDARSKVSAARGAYFDGKKSAGDTSLDDALGKETEQKNEGETDEATPARAYEIEDSPGVALGRTASLSDQPIRVGPMQPRWLRSPAGEPELVYLRRVEVGDQVYQQGVWFNWPVLRRTLLSQSQGLSDQVALTPALFGAGSTWFNPQHQLATIPAVLGLPAVVVSPLGMTPARWSLLLTWVAVIVSVGAIGVVLRTAMSLSDRRVRFVGAVTHELRTPLTTFRLYSQMLADGMVTEEESKKEYLQTLKQESARLAGIVENVLAYARLNRTGGDQGRVRTEVMTPEALLVRLRPGLSRRAEQSGMDLIVSTEPGQQGSRELLVDPQSVEQILTNLVDNACKYALPAGEDDPAAETRIHLDLRVSSDKLEILVADYGPGIDPADRGKVFGEFQRGRAGQRADRSGLGLGLALSRGLARESGGELKLVRRRGHGAEFLLTLPMQAGLRAG